MTTRLLCLPDTVCTTALAVCPDEAGAKVDVAMLEVMMEPSEFVVVTAIVVGSSVELAACEETVEEPAELESAELEPAAVAVADDVPEDVGLFVEDGAAVVLPSLDVGEVAAVVGSATEVSLVGAALVGEVDEAVVEGSVVVGPAAVLLGVSLVT